MQPEKIDYGVINGATVIENMKLQKCKEMIVNRTKIIDLDQNIKEQIFMTLGPMAEEWSNLKLIPTSIYGIRRYRNMSTLIAHIDQIKTHVISAIMNIGQDVEEDWPLYILDNAGNTHKVVIQPGQMVWYESARAVHGRPQPLHGNYYDNIFIHFKPFGKWYSNPFHVNDHKGLKPIKLEDLDRISN